MTYLSNLRISFSEAGAAVLFLALACVAVMLVDSYFLYGDINWLLMGTRNWIDGAVLYDTVIEPNPPMIFYLIRLSYWLSAPLGLTDKSAFLLFVTISAGLSFALIAVLLRRSTLSPNERGVFLAFVAVTFLLVPLSVLADREHFLVIFLAPLAVWMSFEWLRENPPEDSTDSKTLQSAKPVTSPSPYQSAMVGVACALFALPGLLLKPHFFLIPAVAIALRMLQHRSLWPLFAPANIVLAIGAFAFLAFIYWIHPLYIDYVLPLLSITYGYAEGRILRIPSNHPKDMLYTAIIPCSLLILSALVRHAGWSGLWRPSGMLCGMALAGVVIYLVQAKGWYYHTMPAQSFAMLAVGALIIECRRVWRYEIIIYPLLVLALSFHPMGRTIVQYRVIEVYIAIAEPLLAAHGNPKSILAIIHPHPPALPFVIEKQRRWVGRYSWQWVYLPWYRRPDGEAPEKYAKVRRELLRTMADDIVGERPDIIIVDTSLETVYPDDPDPEKDFIFFYSQEPRFAEAWKNYRKIGNVGPYMEFYARKDLLPDAPSD